MVFLFLIGCSRNNEVEGIEVEFWLANQPLACDAFDYQQQTWLVSQLAFFMSELSFSRGNGEVRPELTQSDWQTSDLALIQPKLKDCKGESGLDAQPVSESLSVNTAIRFTSAVNIEEVDEVSFSLGVPFELNHQNPLQQPSPLNLPSMFWSWRSGHKFFRMDLQAPNKSWVFHLGSVGCESASVMRSPQFPCLQPNKMHFRLPKQKSGHTLVVHLDRLLTDVSLANDGSCLFHGEQRSCTILMDNFKQRQVFEWH